MHCHEWRLLLEEHLDGLLSEQQEQYFMTHLADCPSCAALLIERQALATETRTVLLALSAGLRFKPRPATGWSGLLRPRFLLPVAALLLAFVIFIPWRAPKPEPSTGEAVVELELVRTTVGEDEIYISGHSQGREYLIDIRVTSCSNSSNSN